MAEEAAPLEPTTPPPAAPETPPVNPKLQALAELGFADVKDESEGFERLVAAHRQMKDQFSAQLTAAIEQVRAQVRPSDLQTSQPATPSAKKFFDPPSVDVSLVQQYRQPDGTWKEGTPADIRTQAEARERYIQGFAQKLVTDPEGALAPLLEQKFSEFFDRRYGQLSQEQQEQQFFGKALSDNGDWLFVKDAVSGRPTQKLSPEGERFNELMVEAHDQYGIGSRIKQFEYAMKVRGFEKANRAVPADANAARAEQQQKLLGRATPTTNRDGTLPAAPSVRNKNLSPGQKLWQQLQRDGVAG